MNMCIIQSQNDMVLSVRSAASTSWHKSWSRHSAHCQETHFNASQSVLGQLQINANKLFERFSCLSNEAVAFNTIYHYQCQTSIRIHLSSCSIEKHAASLSWCLYVSMFSLILSGLKDIHSAVRCATAATLCVCYIWEVVQYLGGVVSIHRLLKRMKMCRVRTPLCMFKRGAGRNPKKD